jgi:hypothetical protein
MYKNISGFRLFSKSPRRREILSAFAKIIMYKALLFIDLKFS